MDAKRLWDHRDLVWFLAWRDVQVRYKQTLLGGLWAVLQPVAMMIALTAVRRVMGLGGSDTPVFVLAALLPWMFFSATVTGATNSLVANGHMLRKVYFPRLIIPVASVGAPLMDYLVSFGVLAAMMWWFAVPPTAQLLLLPALVITTVIAALGVGLTLSALTVRYRDFRYVVTLLVQVWLFLTPVLYSLEEVPAGYRWLMWLNPMGGTIEAFRSAVLGQSVDYGAWGVSAQVGLLTLVIGALYFSRSERRFADVV